MCWRIVRDGMAAADDDEDRLSKLSHEQWLHEQVLENWTRSGGVGDHSEIDVLHALGVRAALVAVYVVIIVVGVLGNGLVVVVAASRAPRSSSATKSSLQVDNMYLHCVSKNWKLRSCF